ncbi:MAG: hypothetical protein ACI8PB_003017 [Desulforhopalus sp.]|jgi:hypothetical protein
MQCERLIKQIKSWYVHVKDETMAPARMVSFIEQHVDTCDICLSDPDLKEEVAKITELILPESKIPKAVRQQNSKLKAEEEEAESSEPQEEEEVESTTDDLDDEQEEELGLDDGDQPV